MGLFYQATCNMFACLHFPPGSTNMKHDLLMDQQGTHLPLGCITWREKGLFQVGFKITYPEQEPVTAYHIVEQNPNNIS
jgi:hypothetical protein